MNAAPRSPDAQGDKYGTPSSWLGRRGSNLKQLARCCLLGAIAIFAVSCGKAKSKDKLCFPSYSLCDGDVWVRCAGGWLNNFNFYPERYNCRDHGKRCAGPFPNGGWLGCIDVLGACEPSTFKSYCQPSEPGKSTGELVLCVRGEQLAAGDSCDVPKTAASSTPAPP